MQRLREIIESRTPADWIDDQLADIEASGRRTASRAAGFSRRGRAMDRNRLPPRRRRRGRLAAWAPVQVPLGPGRRESDAGVGGAAAGRTLLGRFEDAACRRAGARARGGRAIAADARPAETPDVGRQRRGSARRGGSPREHRDQLQRRRQARDVSPPDAGASERVPPHARAAGALRPVRPRFAGYSPPPLRDRSFACTWPRSRLRPDGPDRPRGAGRAARRIIDRSAGRSRRRGTLKGDADWGMRRLAYEIDHRPEAHYHLFQFEATPGPAEPALDRTCRSTTLSSATASSGCRARRPRDARRRRRPPPRAAAARGARRSRRPRARRPAAAGRSAATRRPSEQRPRGSGCRRAPSRAGGRRRHPQRSAGAAGAEQAPRRGAGRERQQTRRPRRTCASAGNSNYLRLLSRPRGGRVISAPRLTLSCSAV